MAIAGENIAFTLIKCEDNDEWRALRRKGVGGSDVASIMGLSPWRTVAQVWLEKTGRVIPEGISDKPYVAFGNIMEPVIGKWYRENHEGAIVRRVNAVCRSVYRPWAQASLDYEVWDPDLEEWGVLEIKTARDSHDWEDGIPDYYLTQVVHYLSVTVRKFCDVAVFFRDTCEFKVIRYEWDDEDVNSVIGAVDEFWHDFVEADVMPKVVGTAGEASDLAAFYGKSKGEYVTKLGSEVDELISQYQEAAEREKAAKAEKTEASTKLSAIIGEHRGLITDVAKVTWVRSEYDKLDTKKLKEQFPEAWEKCTSKATRNVGIRISDIK